MKKQAKFIKVDFNNIPLKMNISSGQGYILAKLENDNTIRPSDYILEEIAKEHNMPFTTLKSSRESLIEHLIIIPMGRGVYMANPHIFSRIVNNTNARRQWDVLRPAHVKFLEERKKMKEKLGKEKALNNAFRVLTGGEKE